MTTESARRKAQAAEAAVMRGDRLGPLHGVPVSVMDGNGSISFRCEPAPVQITGETVPRIVHLIE